MAESKPSINWGNLDHDSIAEMNKFPHSNSFFPSKFQSRNPLNLSDFNNILINNPDFHPESVPFNQNTNLNFIGDLNENSIKANPNLLMQDKSNDMSKQMNFNIPDKMTNNMNDIIPGSYGFNKFVPKHYQNEFQPASQAKLPTANPFASIPFYFPFLGTYRRPLPPELIEEEPIYVNPRQYERIIKRRIQKASRGIKSDSMTPEKSKQPYKHLSRHLHAKRRIRGKGGRFLSKEADREREHVQNPSKSHTENESPSTSKDHLASTSKSSNGDGDFSQEESDNPGKNNFNERAPKINDNDMDKENVLISSNLKNHQLTTPESKDSKM